jgi:osmotically-inducible protein OsmY
MTKSGNAVDLAKDVVEELAVDPSVDASDIAVSVRGDVVTLRGFVRSYSQKLAAEKATKRVHGVHGIAEELTIELPVFHQRGDADLVKTALDTLRANASIPIDSVLVKAESGWVTLTGTVEWQYQREAAWLAVGSLAGVVGVTNDILLAKRVVTGDVAAKIRDSFRRSAEIDANGIKVELSEGTVTLRGTVHSWTERDDAMTAAFAIPGVWDVRNLTTIA